MRETTKCHKNKLEKCLQENVSGIMRVYDGNRSVLRPEEWRGLNWGGRRGEQGAGGRKSPMRTEQLVQEPLEGGSGAHRLDGRRAGNVG